jgi:ubiquinone/menaquinone biosynthesis C-methylase UbiE
MTLKKILNTFNLFASWLSSGFYYRAMNEALKRIDGNYLMLHYPLYDKENSTFIQYQKNLTDYCISKLSGLKNKEILEIGCGNGVQGMYIYNKYSPNSYVGVDLNPDNIKIANELVENSRENKISFIIGDAQNLTCIADNSIDIILNIESAGHYPDKSSFFMEIHRILKSGGHFVIADVMNNYELKTSFFRFWKNKMKMYHWPLSKYIDNINNSGLIVLSSEDITHPIIKGFRSSLKWLSNLKHKNNIEWFLLKIFFYININQYIIRLKNRQSYNILYGNKP